MADVMVSFSFVAISEKENDERWSPASARHRHKRSRAEGKKTPAATAAAAASAPATVKKQLRRANHHHHTRSSWGFPKKASVDEAKDRSLSTNVPVVDTSQPPPPSPSSTSDEDDEGDNLVIVASELEALRTEMLDEEEGEELLYIIKSEKTRTNDVINYGIRQFGLECGEHLAALNHFVFLDRRRRHGGRNGEPSKNDIHEMLFRGYAVEMNNLTLPDNNNSKTKWINLSSLTEAVTGCLLLMKTNSQTRLTKQIWKDDVVRPALRCADQVWGKIPEQQ